MVLFFNRFDPHHEISKNNKLHLAFSSTKFGSPICHAKCHIIYGISGGESSHAFFIRCHCHYGIWHGHWRCSKSISNGYVKCLMALPTVKKAYWRLHPKCIISYGIWHGTLGCQIWPMKKQHAIYFLFLNILWYVSHKNAKSFETDKEVKRGKRQKYNKITNLAHRVEFLL